MDRLLSKSALKTGAVPIGFKRYLFNEIDYDSRLISIMGARGTGKTTLLLQIGHQFKNKNSLYVALDDLFFSHNTLYDLADEFYKTGGQLLLLDEVHKYPNWSRELKLIYDDLPNLKVVFTSSSILDLYRGESDLSRRVVAYQLRELSFREYLALYHKMYFDSVDFNTLLSEHQSIALKLIEQFKPFQYFDQYLKYGAYPYYNGNKLVYHQQLLQTINLILEVDLPAIQNVDYQNILKIKRLLYVLATNVPFTPNISKLSQKIGLHRNTLVQVLGWLEKAHLIHTYYKKGKSISSLNKPDKIWMHNTNLSYAISKENTDIGNKRESFFLSQVSVNHSISLPEQADFLLDEQYTFEVGGKNKNQKQIANLNNAFVVKDDIEVGHHQIIPLWLFGFLY